MDAAPYERKSDFCFSIGMCDVEKGVKNKMSEKKEYAPSQRVQQAKAALEEQKKNRPEEYQSGWEAQLQELMGRILDREEFRYNLDGDALYRQYRDQAMRDGRLAMQDTIGQAAALTGGYGNTYAQSVGQQAYDRQLGTLSGKIPELYALALDQYRQQSQELQNRYNMLSGQERQDYARYQDALSAWQQEADRLWQDYTDSRDFDYGAYRDGMDDLHWQQNFDENKRRYDQEWDFEHPKTSNVVYVQSGKKKQEETGINNKTKPVVSSSSGSNILKKTGDPGLKKKK